MLTGIICLTKGNQYWSFGKVYEARPDDRQEHYSVQADYNNSGSENTTYGVRKTLDDVEPKWFIKYLPVYDGEIAEAYTDAVEQGKLTWDDVPSEWQPDSSWHGDDEAELPKLEDVMVKHALAEAHCLGLEEENEHLKAELAAIKTKANQITPRDFFAGCALAGLSAHYGADNDEIGKLFTDKSVTIWSVSKTMADAMMAERDKEEVK